MWGTSFESIAIAVNKLPTTGSSPISATKEVSIEAQVSVEPSAVKVAYKRGVALSKSP